MRWRFLFCVCVCVCMFTVCVPGACPLSHLAACGFFHELLNEGKNTPSCPQENSPGVVPCFPSHTLSVVQTLPLLHCSQQNTPDAHTHSHRNTLVFAFFSISLSFPVRTCMPFVARLRVHKNKNMHMHMDWYSVLVSQHNLKNQIKTRQDEQFGRPTYTARVTAASSSHGKVIFTSAAVGRGGQKQHPPPPIPHLKPPSSIFRLSESSRAGRYQPRELKSSFCLKRPSKTSACLLYQQIINYAAQLETQECTTWGRKTRGRKGREKSTRWKTYNTK